LWKGIPLASFPFPKSYRLTSNKVISALFNRRGTRLVQFPVSLIYKELTEEEDHSGFHQHLIAVPKRKIRKAHERNLIRRRVREIIRHEIPGIQEHFPKSKYAMMWMYMSRKEESFETLQKAIQSLTHEFIERNR
jgi:ribonuclease P protein component